MSGIVAIVGKPNVGKSTLFNRLVQERQAIVNEESGVTRDRNYGKSIWNGTPFSVIDTGGYTEFSDTVYDEEIRKQVILAIDEAQVILFVVDSKIGIQSADITISKLLRPKEVRSKVILVANKVDNTILLHQSTEFYALGWETYYPIASNSGSGTGDLLDELVTRLPNTKPVETTEVPKVSIVGRPNVGKSSLINKFLGEDRSIVSDEAGTTRDAIKNRFNRFGYTMDLVDTAGIRKKKSVHENLEFYSVMRSIRTIEGSDVCVVVIDGFQGFEKQDLSILYLAIRNKKGVVLFVNKWDLCPKSTNLAKDYEKLIRDKTAPFNDYPIIFGSVLQSQRLLNIFEAVQEVHKNKFKRIKTTVLNDTLLPIISKNPPPMTKGKLLKIKYITQAPTPFPKFVFFANLPQYIKEPYRRYLENTIRKLFEFRGAPIEIAIKQK